MDNHTWQPSIAVIGAGAVGAYYGSKLQKAGSLVQYQSNTMSKTKRLNVKSVRGNYSLPVEVFANSNQMKPADVVIVTIKVLPSIDLKSLIEPVLKQKSTILILQNGINQDEKYDRLFKKFKPVILGGLPFTCISRLNQSTIQHVDYGSIQIAPLHQNKVDIQKAKQLTDLCNKADIDTSYRGDLRKARYEKLLWNVAYNTLSVILNSTTDAMVNNDEVANLSLRLMNEVTQIAAAENIKISGKTCIAMLERTRNMAPYKTSMLLDYESKRPMEIDLILGELIRMAKKRKISLPHIQMTYDLLQFLDRQNR
ncbi:MAG: 2-dehydropantoate 2-reductase [Leptonema sp. (in: Bacteria)]|nr:2-dehydropantoate 2-reductase [Leptonema sp. (in: bacteria)]